MREIWQRLKIILVNLFLIVIDLYVCSNLQHVYVYVCLLIAVICIQTQCYRWEMKHKAWKYIIIKRLKLYCLTPSRRRMLEYSFGCFFIKVSEVPG